MTTEMPNSDGEVGSDINGNPNPSASAGVPPSAGGPFVCLTRFAGDAAGGAFMGSIFGYVASKCRPDMAMSIKGRGLKLLLVNWKVPSGACQPRGTSPPRRYLYPRSRSAGQIDLNFVVCRCFSFYRKNKEADPSAD
ncbi:Mitochondrial import inner membrane translocase subunit [Nymphaea thermarum]|nr:Mitochondrial import inner membrane translocase subunit [Nymphaea thermarum]